jgi:hypothetical protein
VAQFLWPDWKGGFEQHQLDYAWEVLNQGLDREEIARILFQQTWIKADGTPKHYNLAPSSVQDHYRGRAGKMINEIRGATS